MNKLRGGRMTIDAQHIYEKGYGLVLTILVCVMLICAYTALITFKDYTPIILFAGTTIYLMLLVAVYNIASYLSERALKNIAVVLLLFMAAGLLAVGLTLKSARQADLFNVHYAAVNFVRNGSFGDVKAYLDVYPFQRNFVYVLAGVYKLGEMFGILDYRTSGTMLGAVCLLFAAINTYGIATQLGGRKLGICALALMVTNPIIYLTVSYYYTDTIVMPFFTGIIYFSMLAEKKPDQVKPFFYCLAGLLGHIGMRIRYSAVIAIIAVLIYLWLSNWKTAIKPTAFLVIGMLPSYCVWRYIEMKIGGTINHDLTFPITHCFMMGMNPESGGQWSQAMYSLTEAAPTYSEKISANVAQIMRALQGMGPIGLCQLWVKKMNCLWANGTTAIRTELYIATRYSDLYEYTVGAKRFVTSYAAQMMRCATLICLIPGLISFKRKYKTIAMSIPVTMFGYVLFHLFWEVNERYLLMLFPIMFLVAAVGVVSIHQEFCVERPFLLRWQSVSDERKRKSIYYVIKRVMIMLQIVTIIVAAFCSNEMIGTIDNRYETRVNQPTSHMTSTLSTARLTQTFTLQQPFSSISVNFAKADAVPNGQQYQFILRNGENVLYQQTFLSDDIKTGAGSAKTFSFDTIVSDKTTQYEIQLMALENYEENIGVCHTRKNTRDYYDDGEFVENGAANGDMTFSISEKFIGPLISPMMFCALLGGSLLIEAGLYCWAQWNDRKQSPQGSSANI